MDGVVHLRPHSVLTGLSLALSLSLISLLAGTGGSGATVSAQENAFAVDIQPRSGPPGTLVTIIGRGAPPNTTVRVLWAGYPATLDCRAGRGAQVAATVTADAGGRFTAQHRAPRIGDDQVGGTYLADVPRADGSTALSNLECFTLQQAPVSAETGFRVGDAFWAYFEDGGGVDTFGFPVSNSVTVLGCEAQFFQRHVLQRCDDDPVRPLNLLDPGLMPVERVNGSVFPAHDPAVASAGPPPGAPGYGEAVLDHLLAVVPRTFEGLPVDFFGVFVSTASDTPLSPPSAALRNLELWGFPTSRPASDPTNRDFVYQRFQRGIMHYSRPDEATRGVLPHRRIPARRLNAWPASPATTPMGEPGGTRPAATPPDVTAVRRAPPRSARPS
jgi:hypothetical protein